MRTRHFFQVMGVAVTLLNLPTVVGQTIALKDIGHFVAKFAFKAGYTRDSVDVSQLLAWDIHYVDDWSHDSLWGHFYPDGHWVFLDTVDQNPTVKYSWSGNNSRAAQFQRLRFYVMDDFVGFESQRNILTVWEKIGRDSIRFLCAQIGHYDSGIENTIVKEVTVFPDTSLLLCVEARGGDADEVWGRTTFLRGDDLCTFVPFREASWSTGYYIRVHYDLSLLWSRQFQILETTDFLSDDSAVLGADRYAQRVDSVNTKILDLWDLAADSFDIGDARYKR